VVREENSLAEILEFITAGIEIGQQIVVMAGPTCLKDMALGLSGNGLRPETLLRNGRLIFLTAPDCISQLALPHDPLQRGPLRLNGSVLRWVSDWSWAYGNGHDAGEVLRHQSHVHDFVRSLTHLSLCTVHCQPMGRSSLLAMVADHRRAARGGLRPA
jgi:hypothetical protein